MTHPAPTFVARLAAAGLLAGSLHAQPVQPRDLAELRADEPRAFGHTVGDVIRRRLVVDAPRGSSVDMGSLPRAARTGQALELMAVSVREPAGAWASTRMGLEIELAYQVFLAPTAVRVLEMPPVRLKLTTPRGVQELRAEAWPVSVGPLTPPEAATRQGLGELRPDAPPPATASAAAPRRLAAYALVALAASAYLAWALWGWPWWQSRHRPFQRAWRDLRSLHAQAPREERRAAMQRLHGALNQCAGQVLFERDVPGFVERDARFTALRDELAAFYRHSRREFFDEADSGLDASALRLLARRLRDAERGLA